MALNLSRNTKVFVSSVNGVPTAGGQFLTGYISAGGSNYVVGDRLLFTGAVTTNVYFVGIVETVSSGAVTKLNINGNGVGVGIAASEALTESTAHTTVGGASSGTGCIVE